MPAIVLVLIIVLLLVSFIALIYSAVSEAVRKRALALLTRQLAGALVTVPPSPINSAVSRVKYTFTLAIAPVATAITATSPFHAHLSIRVVFTLTGAGGATFVDGSRSFAIPMSQNGDAETAIMSVAHNNSDQLTVTFELTDIKANRTVLVTDPVKYDFETIYP